MCKNKPPFRNQPISSCSLQKGVVLLEALIAILIFSFGVIGLLGLQATMIKNTTDANYRVVANYIVQQRLGRAWADPCNLVNTGVGEAIPELPNGEVSVEHEGDAARPPDPSCGNGQNFQQTTVMVTWMLPGDGNPLLPRTDPSWRRVRQSTSITGG